MEIDRICFDSNVGFHLKFNVYAKQETILIGAGFFFNR